MTIIVVVDPTSLPPSPLATYADLVARVGATPGYDDQTSSVPVYIALAESKIQTEAKLLELETSATVTVIGGTGDLPAGFLSMRSVYWEGSPDRPLSYITPERYDSFRGNDSGDGYYYTITGGSINTTPMGDGAVVCTYSARFTPLSDVNPTNAILTNFPDVYLFGTLMYAALSIKDDADMQKYGVLFNAALDRMNKNNEDRKYAGSTLQVRAR